MVFVIPKIVPNMSYSKSIEDGWEVSKFIYGGTIFDIPNLRFGLKLVYNICTHIANKRPKNKKLISVSGSPA